jgi:hypothetical protein
MVSSKRSPTAGRSRFFLLALAALAAGAWAGGLRPASNLSTVGVVSISVQTDVIGKTPTYLGGTEGAAFYISDLLDLGFNTYRLFTAMAELEPWDDDDAADGTLDGSDYGTPTISQIKADKPSGFKNTIPWAQWDFYFQNPQTWRYGVQTRQGIIDQLVQNGITPLVLLRTYNALNSPERRPTATWAPRPPVDTAFRNEWWEHCFAVAYWLNVKNHYGITHFSVLNEPDIKNKTDPTKGQGWANYGGTKGDYVKLVKDAYSAVSYANKIAGLPTFIHAPVIASFGTTSPWIPFVLDRADQQIQYVDFHKWDPNDPGAIAKGVRDTVAAHNTDGVVEPLWISEWGTYDWSTTPYTTLARAIKTGDQLMAYAERDVQALTIYNTYQWGVNPIPPQTGLMNLIDNGAGGVLRVKTETYYAYRLLLRGLNKAKDRLKFTASGLGASGRAMVARDPNALYVLLKNGNGSVNVDLSALPCYAGRTATVYEYSATKKDQIQGNPTVTAGHLVFTAPDSSLVLAKVPGC